MKTASRPRLRRGARRISLIWSELEYAQRRRARRDFDRRGKRPQAELDALYAVPPSKRPLPR
jgi:hypothetical protein